MRWIYLIFINIVSFCLFYWDKRKAVYHKRRIPESVLLCSALLGGAPGAYVAMFLFHHKTRKWRFSIGILMMIIGQIYLIPKYLFD